MTHSDRTPTMHPTAVLNAPATAAARPRGPHPDPFEAYVRRVARLPRLSAREERRLGLAMLDGGPAARAARQRLVEAHLPLVLRLARRHRAPGVPLADLVQEGNLGLLAAADRFDPLRGVRFATYATWWIRQAIMDASRRYGSVLPPSSRMRRKLAAFERTRADLTRWLGRPPRDAELAAAMGTDENAVRVLAAHAARTVTLQGLPGEGEGVPWADAVADTRAAEPLERVLLEDELAYLLGLLRPREALILALRFGLLDGSPWSLEAIGVRLGITRQRVLQIEARAIEKLRALPDYRPARLADVPA